MTQLQTTALYLRADGSLLVARGEVGIELQLTPAQLIQLGMDALRMAVALDPRQMAAAVDALANTYVLPPEVPECPHHH